ncbi:helix-turn-helix domain-containing protein [Agrococcus sp. ARC_14]|uniref:TetR/AcrR family transcriptional regulator n=1 Tax=Agrococcus sp. ARC_14 TaxID=2919927 RepID=UPI001F063CE7|nr:helix-turn-helix domain-containing protein [Agrococcus sp. ARC_14]MCH1884345.1 TetR/AcrR family transcriptional regulator [Agrococcus sp. ARC_14]
MDADRGISSLEASRLRASEGACELFIARDTTDLTVAEITGHIGVPARSFHRYFPSKAECVAPLFDWTTRRFDQSVVDAPADLPVPEVLRGAFRAGLGGEVAPRTRALFPLVFADDAMWSVFLRKVHDGERALGPALAPRLGIDPASIPARAAAAAVASATRIALETMVIERTEPEETYMALIDAFASGAIRRM